MPNCCRGAFVNREGRCVTLGTNDSFRCSTSVRPTHLRLRLCLCRVTYGACRVVQVVYNPKKEPSIQSIVSDPLGRKTTHLNLHLHPIPLDLGQVHLDLLPKIGTSFFAFILASKLNRFILNSRLRAYEIFLEGS
jgi:hypothetical protein